MKDKVIVYCALAISIAALGYSIYMHQNARQMADQALRERETRLVKAFAPRIQMALRDMGATNIVTNPSTLEELFGPMVDLMNGLDVVTNESRIGGRKP